MKVKYIGGKHPMLKYGEVYEVFTSNVTGVQVRTRTGFAGIQNVNFTKEK